MSIESQLRAALSDRYDIERELGGGGMSLVYVATERALERRVVIKVLHPDLSQSVNAERFRREIATLATLQHPQIVPIHAAGNADTLLYYVMPFVAGESLRARLERDGPLSTEQMVRVIVPLARALAYAHREGVVHRDIKPENVLLAQGEPVLADFGIARVVRDGGTHTGLTSMGVSLGTVTYMAPEQVLAEPNIDGRADVYSLAAMAWELLTGRAPFDGTAQQVMSAHVVKPAPELVSAAPSVPPAVAAVIMRALGKTPDERPDAETFATDLEGALRQPVLIPSSAAPLTSSGARADERLRGGDGHSVASGGGVARAVLVGGLLLVAVVGGWWWRSNGASSAGATSTGSSARPGVAVLPFERIGDVSDAYLAAGLTDELMTQLGGVVGLRVAASTSVRAFIDSALPPAELGKRLDVRALIEGSVQRAGTQLRVSTRLVDVADGTTIWSDRYERTMDDLFAVQREIGGAVVAALAPRLGIAPASGASIAGRVDPAAFDWYLRGRFALRQRGVDSLQAAIAHFKEAVSRDSSFAPAWAAIAEATSLLPLYGGGAWEVHAVPLRAAAARALALDSTLGAPHFALGTAAKGMGDWAAAEQEFDRALARQPDLGATHQNRAELLYTLGRIDEAVQAMAQAARLEPQDAPIISQFAGTLVIAGQLDSAQRTLDRALRLDPNLAFAYWSAMMLAERRGDLPGALKAAQRAASLAPLPFFTGLTVRAARLAGDAAAERTARAALAALGNAPGVPLAQALADIEVAPPARTQALLEAAVAAKDPLMWQLPLRLWWFDALRATPALRAIADRLGLPPQVLEPLPAPARR